MHCVDAIALPTCESFFVSDFKELVELSIKLLHTYMYQQDAYSASKFVYSVLMRISRGSNSF